MASIFAQDPTRVLSETQDLIAQAVPRHWGGARNSG
jgi:hypothetical protein